MSISNDYQFRSTRIQPNYLSQSAKASNTVTTNPIGTVQEEICSAQAAEGLRSTALAGISQNKDAILIDDDTTLFAGASKQPELSFDRPIEPESLVMVHMTNYFPHGGKVLSTNKSTGLTDEYAMPRTTIHFALNKAVTEHALGNKWNTMQYAVITPFKQTVENMPKEKILGGIMDDFFFQDEVPLSEGSIIVKYNDSIPKGKLKISQATDNGMVLKGIKLIESSDKNLGDVATRVIQKMGYTSAADIYTKEFSLEPEEEEIYEKVQNDINYVSFDELLRVSEKKAAKIEEATTKINDTWEQFCKDKHYAKGLHTASPWGRSELVISAIQALIGNDVGWKNQTKDIGEIDYKKEFLKVLEECKEQMPKGMSFGFDIDKLYEIIANSDTPKQALENIKQEMKLVPMLPRKEENTNQEKEENLWADVFDKDTALYLGFDSLLGLAECTKPEIKKNYVSY